MSNTWELTKEEAEAISYDGGFDLTREDVMFEWWYQPIEHRLEDVITLLEQPDVDKTDHAKFTRQDIYSARDKFNVWYERGFAQNEAEEEFIQLMFEQNGAFE